MDEPTERVSGQSLPDALDELVTRAVWDNGDDIDRAEVWELIARWALHQRRRYPNG